MLRVHKIRLRPTDLQATSLLRACGTARFAYNWALTRWQEQYAAHRADSRLPRPTEGALRKELNALKRSQFPWMLEVTKCAPQEAIRALGAAFKNFFAGRARHPTFKKRGRRDAFKISSGFFDVEGCRIRIPNLGWVRMREPLRYNGRLVSVAISRTAHAWFASVTVETDDVPFACENQAAVGIDLGVKSLAVLSTGEAIAGPKPLLLLMRQVRLLTRAHGRKQKGSANRRKAAARLARLHWRIACVRQDGLHKLSDRLTREFGLIFIEDLNVLGMLANQCLARHIADQGFSELRRQLTYKAEQRGVRLVTIGRWQPTSKRCSSCGEVHKKLTLGDRSWVCSECDARHDRDINAAKNILAAGFAVSACGENGSGLARKSKVQPISVKQETSAQVAEAIGVSLVEQ